MPFSGLDWKDADKAIMVAFFGRARRLKDKHYTALLLVEFFLTMILVASVILWLDHRYNLVEFPINLMIFAACLLAVLHFYNYTSAFRDSREMQRKASFRIFALELIIFTIVVSAAYVYQDQSLNTLQYPFNFILFLFVLLPVLWVYINEKFIKPKI